MSFGPDQIAFVVFVVDADQFLELLLRLLKFCGVGSFRCRLRAPGSVGEAKLDPARFGRREASLVDLAVDLIGASVGAGSVKLFRVSLEFA